MRWPVRSILRSIKAASGALGPVTAANSLLNTSANDLTFCNSTLNPLPDGNASLHLPKWSSGGNIGAFTLISASGVPLGAVSAANSVLGLSPSGGSYMVSAYDAPRLQLYVGRPYDNRVTILRLLPDPKHWVYLPAVIK